MITRLLGAMLIAALSVGPVSAATVSSAHIDLAQAAASQGTVAGTVLDETGAPVAGATITLKGASSYSTTTDAHGRFTLSANPGLYLFAAHKAGFDTASEADYAIIAGQSQSLSLTMHTASFSTLRTIATVRTRSRGTFNTTTASVNSVSNVTFQDQSQPQVVHILDEIPGVQIAYPQGGGNAASPGAITFPSVRGGLGFETATLIDGHPLSVGGYGDYVTSFLSSYLLQSADVIKGPGAMSPQTNYAIGGTINFRTLDPTAKPDTGFGYGLDNFGGSYLHFKVSDTIGRLGFVVGIAHDSTNGGIRNEQVAFAPNGAIINTASGPTELTYNDKGAYLPGTASQTYSQYGAIACCASVNGDYDDLSELVKLRYRFSNATTATVSYLGSQATADQNANTSDVAYGLFEPSISAAPGQIYTGPIAPGSTIAAQQNFYMVTNTETNNEPILQAEIASSLGTDTVLARFYHAGIERLKTQGNANPAVPQEALLTFNGIDANAGVLNNLTTIAKYYTYYNNPEIDSLNGTSFQYEHPVANNLYSFAYNGTRTETTIYATEANVTNNAYSGISTSGTIPAGSGQYFQTYMLRGQWALTPKLSGITTLYENQYQSTFLQNCLKAGAPTTCTYDTNGYPTNDPNFITTNTNHFDERFGLEFRPKSNIAVRATAGSAIAPPYIALLTTADNAPSASPGSTYALQSVNTGQIRPETAFGYDLGMDYAFKDGVTTASVDGYLTNLFNQFISGYEYDSGLICNSTLYPTSGCPAPVAGGSQGIPLYYKGNVNLNNSRYEGIEARLTRAPQVGLGYMLEGAITRAYTYNLTPTFYCSNPTVIPAGATSCVKNQLLGVVPNVNFTGGVPSAGYGYPSSAGGGVNNINVPYLNAYAEVNFRTANGAYASFGYNVIGKNNWINEPAFGVANATIRYPINDTVSVQVSGWNIFNAYPGVFPIAGGGVAVPLAAVPAAAPAGSPALGATSAGQLGPATYHFEITKTLGALPASSNGQ